MGGVRFRRGNQVHQKGGFLKRGGDWRKNKKKRDQHKKDKVEERELLKKKRKERS